MPRSQGQQCRVCAEYRRIVFLSPESSACSRLFDDNLFGGESHNLLDRSVDVEWTLQRTCYPDRSVLAHKGRHALGLKVELLVESCRPVSLDYYICLDKPLFYVACSIEIFINNVVASPDDLFSFQRLFHRQHRLQRLYLRFQGCHGLFEKLCIRSRHKCNRLRHVIYLFFRKRGIIVPYHRNVVFTRNVFMGHHCHL
ncbi:hypothetical protein SDC9_178629 [bioreactor metagenome]|uniref:Uncharacterized protein n=1 Tax=bioreactor metagenome TaxID=1076179 RepID=A0A645GWG9_9ZZZZ